LQLKRGQVIANEINIDYDLMNKLSNFRNPRRQANLEFLHNACTSQKMEIILEKSK